MSGSLDRPAGVYGDPGPDQRLPTLSEAVDTVLMIATKDAATGIDDRRELQRLMSGLQAAAAQKAAQAQQQPQAPDEGTSDFGATDGTEPAANTGSLPGQQDAGAGY